MARQTTTGIYIWICVIVLSITASQSEEVFAIYGKSTSFHCPLTPTSEIKWYDFVYNSAGGVPAVVYEDGVVNDDEYHKGRFSVDPTTFDLTITNLNEDDVGEYYCETAPGTKHQFMLALGKMPECQGHVADLRDGEQTNLICTMEYTGNSPAMQWLRVDEVIDSVDETEIRIAKHTAQINVVPAMDKQTFTCRVVVGDMVEECSLTFEVKYGVQDLMISPEQESYTPGSEFMCSAKGNPAPEVKVTFPDGEVKTAVDMVKVVIPAEWEGFTKSILCEAENLEDGILKMVKNNFTFTVSSKVEATPEPEGTLGEDEEGQGGGTQMAGIVAGIVIGAVVLVIIIIAVVCVKRRQSKPPKGSKPVPTKEDAKGDANA